MACVIGRLRSVIGNIKISRRGAFRRGKLFRVVLVLLVGLGVALNAVLSYELVTCVLREHERGAALDAVKVRVGDLLTLDAKTLETDLVRARAQTTSPFSGKYGQLLGSFIVPSIRKNGIATRAKVVRAAVISVGRGQVETLVYIDQTTTTSGAPQPQEDNGQLKISMKKVGTEWLIAELSPI